MLRISGVIVLGAVGFYLIFVYLTTYLSQTVKIPLATALEINTVSMILLMILVPFFGHLADRVGPERIVLAVTIAALLLTRPLFWLLHHQNPWIDLLGELGFVMLIAPYQGAYPAMVVNLLPEKAKCTVLSVGFNLCVGLVGGTTPMVASYLIRKTNNDYSPAWFLMFTALITLVTTINWMRVMHSRKLTIEPEIKSV
jgi:MHS family proline/betaine transporter-like MFS transporter